tara:strand:- start:772 stop:1122 length:351 start_codon:yes stop_codon:yes gene_type:complete
MSLNYQQSIQIRNAVYGLTLSESLKLWQSAESTRKQMIWNAIERFWPADSIEFEDYLTILKLFLSFNPLQSEMKTIGFCTRSESNVLADFLGRVDDEHPNADSFEGQLCNMKKEPV